MPTGSISRFFAALVTPLWVTHVLAQTNTTEGDSAGASLTSSAFDNSFFGDYAGYSGTIVDEATLMGAQTGQGVLDTSLGNTIRDGAIVTTDFFANNLVAIGYRSAWQSDSPFYCTYVGALTGQYDKGNANTFIGSEAGKNNTDGDSNTFMGALAGQNNTTGYENVFVGEDAGQNNTTGYQQTFIGLDSGKWSSTGHSNTAFGLRTLSNVSGCLNTAAGALAGYDLTDGVGNTMFGAYAGGENISTDFNTTVGAYAGHNTGATTGTDDGSRNTFVGTAAGFYNVSGQDNNLVGAFTGQNRHASSSYDTANWSGLDSFDEDPTFTLTSSTADTDLSRRNALGAQVVVAAEDALAIGYASAVTGERGIAIGTEANVSDDDGVAIGYQATSHGSDIIVLGNSSMVSIDPDAHRTTDLGSTDYRWANVYSSETNLKAASGEAATIDFTFQSTASDPDWWSLSIADSGNLSLQFDTSGSPAEWFSITNAGDVVLANDVNVYSDQRLKQDIRPIHDPLAILQKVDGKTYHWRKELGRDSNKKFGVIAQEVEAVLPELVTTDSNGIKSVNYQSFIPLLISGVNDLKAENQQLQERLNQQRMIRLQQQEAIAHLKQQIAERRTKLAGAAFAKSLY